MSLSPILTDPEDRRQALAAIREDQRNPAFDPDTAELIVQALASGMGITAVGGTPGYPPYWIINYWRTLNPEFDEACVRAAEAYADLLAAEMVPIADGTAPGHSDRSTADRALSVSTRLQAAKILNRKKYDPAVKVSVAHSAVGADELSDAELLKIATRAKPLAAISSRAVDSDSGDAL